MNDLTAFFLIVYLSIAHFIFLYLVRQEEQKKRRKLESIIQEKEDIIKKITTKNMKKQTKFKENDSQ
jgi:hypothetical protein